MCSDQLLLVFDNELEVFIQLVLNKLNPGRDKGHVMHFMDQEQHVMLVSVWGFFLIALFETNVPFQSLTVVPKWS